MSAIDFLFPSSTLISEVPSSITAAATTVTVFHSSSSTSINTSATPVGLSECVQRCVINVATGGPYGTCTAQLQDMGCICNDEMFQAATQGCIPNVCPMETSSASHFASQFCAGVIVSANGTSSNSTSGDAGLSVAAVAGIGIGSAVGGMSILAIVGLLLSGRFNRRGAPKQRSLSPNSKESARAELPGYQTEAQEAEAVEAVSPVSPIGGGKSPLDGRSPIETVLSRDEQDELHALREKMKAMRLELAMLEERERAELDGGIGGLKEMPA